MESKNIKKRSVIITALFAAVLCVFVAFLFFIQTVNADKYIAHSRVSSYNVSVDAPRGEILDRSGNALVYNERVNTFVFNYLSFPRENDKRNAVINRLISFVEAKGEKWKDLLPIITKKNGEPCFSEHADAAIQWLKSKDMLAVNPYATAKNCLNVLTEKYDIKGYSPEQTRKIASVRYNMDTQGFSPRLPYVFAENISVSCAAYVSENSDIFTGVEIGTAFKRQYTGNGKLAPHVLGVTGPINREEYAEKNGETEKLLSDKKLTDAQKTAVENKKYLLNDQIGKNGIEGAMEKYLRGSRGIKTVSTEPSHGVSEELTVPPKAGNTVCLTIDRNLQETADSSLKNRVLAVTTDKILAKGLTPAGALVVLDVNTGAVLASSSYPTYSLGDYYSNYHKLADDEKKPLWNRAFQNAYSPGSTMKPVIAAAALEEKVITPSSTVTCTGTYQYIDQTFGCFEHTAHGTVNVKQALEHSCNIFFFEAARKLGIDRMNTYASLFGLGEKTGIETEETKGILAGMKYRDSIGKSWKAGETLLAAIGQSDNSFTPLQLANYCATIANGGTRYVPYLVEKIISSDCRNVIFEHKPNVAVQTNISAQTIDTVKEGMYRVANYGSCRNTLGKLNVKTACKTGTAEKKLIINGKVVDGTDGLIIAFGPYDDPQIAVCVVVENAGSGASTSQVAADIFEYYFSNSKKKSKAQQPNSIIW